MFLPSMGTAARVFPLAHLQRSGNGKDMVSFLGWMMTVIDFSYEGQDETKVSPVVYYEGSG